MDHKLFQFFLFYSGSSNVLSCIVTWQVSENKIRGYIATSVFFIDLIIVCLKLGIENRFFRSCEIGSGSGNQLHVTVFVTFWCCLWRRLYGHSALEEGWPAKG